MSLIIAIIIALGLDYWLGEPKRLHPLVGFGSFADGLEKWLNCEDGLLRFARKDGSIFGLLRFARKDETKTQSSQGTKPPPENSSLRGEKRRGNLLQFKGVLALTLAIGPLGFAAYSIEQTLTPDSLLSTLLAGVVLYLAIGWHSLIEHAKAISIPLSQGDLISARTAVSRIVSRDTQALNEPEIAKAATESVLENGADALFSALFWFIIAGIPGVVIYRLSNTLDAMWGYKNSRFLHFGWAAARFDDLLNFIPARLTALAYTMCGSINGQTKNAWQSWRQQAGTWKSPNAGPVMAAGAGAIGVELGGSAQYHGQNQERPTLGSGQQPNAQSIDDACDLVNHSLVVWLVIICLLAFMGTL
jgi:adenosylcobinamide-phosphate synthase